MVKSKVVARMKVSFWHDEKPMMWKGVIDQTGKTPVIFNSCGEFLAKVEKIVGLK